MNRPMELNIWGGDWGLPSVDLHCLEVMAYAKFSGVPLQTCVTNNPFWTPNGRLPVFKHGKQVLSSFPEIAAYLRKKNFSADFGLTPKQCAEVVAYTQLLKAQLYLALQYVWWVDTKNYVELIRPWYAKALPLPYNYYYPGRYEREAKTHLEALYDQDDDPLTIESYVYGEAEKCLTTLSVRLGEQDFFFGSHPTSLDATVYAYLAPLLKVPFPSPALQNYLKACSNLVKFVVRITQRYFPYAIQEYEAKKTAEEGTRAKTTDSESDFPNRRRNQILAGLFATVAMTGYALSTGLVQVSARDDLGERLDDYEELFESADNEES
ncbi:metaxin-1 isoform X2 [Periplaneta americana]|uniref:metaxin-1 isoform X2 n=1 Tax=Periplaneta americana TaxID=6978 RepID=UPI0037E6FCBE